MEQINKKLVIKVLVLAIFGSLIVSSVFSSSNYSLGPFTIETGIHLIDHGETALELTPFGTVSAVTHATPLEFMVSIEGFDLNQLTELVMSSEKNQEQLIEKFTSETYNIVKSFVAKVLLLAGIGGAGGVFLGGLRKPKYLLAGLLIGVLVMGLLLSVSYVTYDTYAFNNPEFHGTLETFPWMMGVVEDSILKLDTLGEQLESLSRNLFVLFERIDELEHFDFVDGELKVLHVADIHNNPAAYDFISQITRSFEVDIIIDSGDIADYGTPIEAELAARIEELEVPYLFIPGNHDSPDIIDRISEIPNAFVLTERAEELLGLSVAGIRDPASVSTSMAVPDEKVLEEYVDTLREYLDNEDDISPDILVAHHPYIASSFLGEVPVLLTGHTHRQDITFENDSVLINAGTTGAAGIRGIQSEEEIPYSVALLHFSQAGELRAVDMMKVRHLQAGYRIERIMIDEENL